MRWFTSDQHFGNPDIMEQEQRPFPGVGEMAQLMTLNWNQLVEPDDTVFVLGGFSDLDNPTTLGILQDLNGIKIYLRSTRERSTEEILSLGFTACLECAFMTIGPYECYMSHEPFPMSAPKTWTIHGQPYGQWKFKPLERLICVSVDNWKYAPVSETELIALMDRATNPWDNHNGQEDGN